MQPLAQSSPSKPFRPHEIRARCSKIGQGFYTRFSSRELDTDTLDGMECGRLKKNDLIVVVTSVGTEEQALDVAHALVRSRRAACVNILPNVHSVYRWKGRVCDDGEMLLIIKSRVAQFDAIRETIQRVNTYELPEVLGYRVDMASPGFETWIDKMTAAPLRKKVVKLKAVRSARARAAAGKTSRRESK
jgi:periplasmic divalent cation tolerance protein